MMEKDDVAGLVERLGVPIVQTYMPASSEPDGDALEAANRERAQAADALTAQAAEIERLTMENTTLNFHALAEDEAKRRSNGRKDAEIEALRKQVVALAGACRYIVDAGETGDEMTAIEMAADALAALPAGLADMVLVEREVRDAYENLHIAVGMGWDLDGVIKSLQTAIAAQEPRP